MFLFVFVYRAHIIVVTQSSCQIRAFSVAKEGTFTAFKMVEKILQGTWAEAMLIGIPALTIVIAVMVRVSMCIVSKVKQVRNLENFLV